PPSSGLPPLLPVHAAERGGRQHRARDQLLGDLPGLHSPSLGGFAVISHWVPFLLFSVHAGALADRFDCRRLIQLSQGLFMLASLCWPVLFFTGGLRLWHAVAILMIHGAAGVIAAPAAQLIIHDIVGRETLPSAIRLNATSRYLAILLG